MRKCRCYSHNGMLLSPEGLAQREFDLPGVDGMASGSYLDSRVSMSAFGHGPDPIWPSDQTVLEQGERFHSGA